MSETKTIGKETKRGANYAHYNGGSLAEWSEHELQHPIRGKVRGKHFLKDHLNFTGCEISINSLARGGAVPFSHQHKENEEVYIFITGKGQMQIDHEVIDVTEGSIVRVSPNGMRTWRNTGDEPLVYVVI
ncbi:MAG: cupin domain-containing protein, partial [Candidatus Obscuribacterales bacterium]|nr:cupin domain-containing protein [Candidatus Obscuribacterales bacterium]